jgi:hypothetical protein
MLNRNTKRSLAVLAATLLLALIALAGALCTAHGTARANGWTWDRPAETDGWTWDRPAAVDGWTWDDAVTSS